MTEGYGGSPSLICASVAVQRSFCKPSRAYRSSRLSLPFFFFFFLLFQLILQGMRHGSVLPALQSQRHPVCSVDTALCVSLLQLLNLQRTADAFGAKQLTQEVADPLH